MHHKRALLLPPNDMHSSQTIQILSALHGIFCMPSLQGRIRSEIPDSIPPTPLKLTLFASLIQQLHAKFVRNNHQQCQCRTSQRRITTAPFLLYQQLRLLVIYSTANAVFTAFPSASTTSLLSVQISRQITGWVRHD